MKLIKRNRFEPMFPSLFDDFFSRDFFNLPADVPSIWNARPAVNVSEDENAYGIELAAPGLRKEDLKVEVDKGLLTISYEHQDEKKEEENGKYTRREFTYNSFKRSFTLPEDVKGEDHIQAKYEDGILKVLIPKAEKEKPKASKTIQIG